MPRKRHYEEDGMILVYSPLSLDQVEEILSRKPPEETAPQQERDSFFRKWNLDVIRQGLNNAALAAGAPEWTDARIMAELDPMVYNAIEDLILKMTGLKDKQKSLGEAAAATSS